MKTVVDLVSALKTYFLNKDKDVYEVMGQNGAKNLLVNNIKSGTYNSLSITKNSDGSITFNGQAASVTNLDFLTSYSAASTGNIAHSLEEWGFDKKQKYIITIGHDSYVPCGIRLVYLDSSMNILGNNYYTITSDSYVLEFTETFANTAYMKILAYASTSAISDVTIYPMIRLASDTDNTYQPYVKTNQALTNEVKDMNNVLGAKNLLPTPYYTTKGGTATLSGLTFVEKQDGSIVCSGTNTSSSTQGVNIELHNDCSLLAGKTITVSVKNAPLFENAYCPIIFRDSSGTNVDRHDIYGECPSYTFDVPSNAVTYDFQIYVRAGKGLNSTIYPMIRLASIIDDTYVPYAKTNQQLTQDGVSWDDNAIIGAHNLWCPSISVIKSRNTSGTWSNNIYTINGGTITFTVNDDLVTNVTINGTFTAEAIVVLNHQSDGVKVPKDGAYRVSGCNGGSTTTYYIQANHFENNSEVSDGTVTDGGEVFNYKTTYNLKYYLRIKAGTYSNVSVKFMLCFGFDLSEVFELPVKTNRELTEDITSLLTRSLSDCNTVPNNGRLNIFRSSSSTLNSPYTEGIDTGNQSHVILSLVDTNNNWGVQLAIPVTYTKSLFMRFKASGTWGAWSKITP